MGDTASMSMSSHAAPKVFSIVGHSGSGKTTLVEKLIRELCVRGVKVATIKHAHHKVELDTPGKDSFRYKDAGAVMSMLLTRDALQLVADAQEEREPEQLAQRFLGEADLVLAEGFSHAPGAKIEVLRRACDQPPRCAIEDGLIAIVTDMDEVYPQLPHFALDDVNGIVDFILQRAAR
jgi:molybdopterin-guanine dinucleotide biosynthesis protein B